MAKYDLSLMPSGSRNAGALMPTKPTLRVLAICGALLLVLLAARWHFNKQLSSEQASLNQANAVQQQLQLRSQNIKKQLEGLQGAGGASKIDLVRGLSQVPADWKKMILAVAQESSPGISISTFTGSVTTDESTSSGSSGGSDETGNSIQISGSAESQDQLQAFVKRLRKQSKVFTSVELKKASATEEEAAPGAAQPDRPSQASEKVEWDMVLTLPPGAPMPSGGAGGGQQ